MTKIIIPLVVSIFLQAPTFAQQVQESKDPKDPKVVARLDEMGKYLRSLKQFELDSDVTFEVLVDDDQKIDMEGKLKYKVKSPNKLWVDLQTDYKHRQYFYDEGQLTVYSPDQKYYATVDAPKTLSELLDVVQEKFKIEFPLSDLFDWGTEKGKFDRITNARFIQEYTKDNVRVEHYFIRQGHIDWQVWIPKGDKPLPQKIVYVDNKDVIKPKFTSHLKWKLNPQINDKIFKFVPQKDTFKIEFNPKTQPENK